MSVPADRADRPSDSSPLPADRGVWRDDLAAAPGGAKGAPADRDDKADEKADKAEKDKRHRHFWRASAAVWPYRRIVAVSVVCAFFVGLCVSGGLTTMLPILRVLLNGQTVRAWVDSQVVEKRLGVKLADDNSDVRLLDVRDDKPAAAAGLRKGDQLHTAGSVTVASAPEAATRVLADLADPAATTVRVTRDTGTPADLALPPLQWHYGLLRQLVSVVSDRPVVAIAQVFCLIATLAIVGNILKFFQEYLSDKAAILAVNDIRRRLYDHVLHVPMSHLSRRGTSDMTSRLVQDSTNLEMGFKTVLGQSVSEPIKAAMAFALALAVSWKLTLAIVVFAPVMGAIIRKFGKKMRRASRAALQKSSHMLGQIESTLAGIKVVKGASAERFERRRYRSIMAKLMAEQLKMSRIDAFSAPTLETLTLLVVGGVVLIASYMVLVQHTLSATSFFLVMACLGTIADSMRRVNKVNNVLQKSNAAAARIYEVMDLPVERRREGGEGRQGDKERGRQGEGEGADGRGAANNGQRTTDHKQHPRIKLSPLRREIRFDRVTFSYPDAPTPAIEDVSLTVPKGRCVAVVGRNGSGKTTLLALLPRFYDPQAGRVLLDGVDVRDATLRSLRGQISIVTQDSVIFPGTIAQNIAYANPRATRDQIVEAAKRAFAHEFILQKPRGYDTALGELGGSLSGGQKQRICIARAILRNAPVLVLDEATSQVDAESEHLIQQAIDSLMHDRGVGDGPAESPTTFVIAHRFSTILGADTIVVMDQGRVVGQGRHDELLATCETYQQLYERQLVAVPAAAVAAPAVAAPAVPAA